MTNLWLCLCVFVFGMLLPIYLALWSMSAAMWCATVVLAAIIGFMLGCPAGYNVATVEIRDEAVLVGAAHWDTDKKPIADAKFIWNRNNRLIHHLFLSICGIILRSSCLSSVRLAMGMILVLTMILSYC